MKRKVIIIGQGYTGRLSITRSVAEIGCEVTLITTVTNRRFSKKLDKRKPIDAYSKYVKNIYFCMRKDGDALMRILMDKCRDDKSKPIIFPDNDFSAAFIDQNKDMLKEHFLFPYIKNDSASVIEWMDKTKQKELAVRLGLNVAESNLVKISDGKYTLPSDKIKYPCFAKPKLTIIGGKVALRKCNNESELREHLDSMCYRKKIDVLVEDYKEIQEEFSVVGFSDGENAIIPGVLQLLKLAHAGHFGVAIQGKIFPVTSEHEAFIEILKQYILSIGFVGVFDFDYYKSGGIMYFGELNLRFGGSGYAYTKMGANLPAMFVKFISGEKYDDMQLTVNGSATYVNERMLIDEWTEGLISKKEMDKLYDSSDIKFVENQDDLEPLVQLKKFIRICQFKKFIKACIGKK